jgi:hypothetical protein
VLYGGVYLNPRQRIKKFVFLGYNFYSMLTVMWQQHCKISGKERLQNHAEEDVWGELVRDMKPCH